MALVECIKCGGKISDSAKICPHCGYDFAAEKLQGQKAREFSKLSADEQTVLREEYDSLSPDFSVSDARAKKIDKQRKICFILCWIFYPCLGVFSMVLAFGKLHGAVFSVMAILAFVFFLLTVAVSIAYYAYGLKRKRAEATRLRELKKFRIWLNENKQMTYNIILNTEKERILFDSFSGKE